MDNEDEKLESAIKQHFEKNGEFDAEKSRSALHETLNGYKSTMKKIEWIVFVYLAATVAIALFAVSRFTSPGVGMKEMIAYAVLFIFAIETQVLMKLWYWVMNVKISILKELKLQRLDRLGEPIADENEEKILSSATAGSSKKARWLRSAGLVAVAIITVLIFPLDGNFDSPQGLPMECERVVTINADGSGSSDTRYSFPNDGAFPLESFSMFSDLGAWEGEYEDFSGRQISFTVKPEGTGQRTTLDLPEAIMPGERLFLKCSMKTGAIATKEDDIWTFWDGQSWSYASSRYDYKVILPQGAEVVSVEPEPWRESEENGAEVLFFKAERRNGGHFGLEVQYRLPAGQR